MKHKWKRWLGCLLLCTALVLQSVRMGSPALGAEQETISAGEETGIAVESIEEEETSGTREKTADADGETSEACGEAASDVSETEASDVSEATDVTEDYDLSKKEVRQSITDAVYEEEIKERANAAYTSVDDLKIVNAVVVKQSLFDRALVKDGDTIDSVMSGIEEGDAQEAAKFLTQISNVVALYELSEESDYYVAFVNTMDSDPGAEVRDYVFAGNDNDGNVLSDCIYEAETGLAYIPKTDCINDAGEQIVLNVQVQLMQLISSEDPSSEMITSVNSDGTSVEVCASEADIFDVETTVETEKGLEEASMTVAVNGVPIQEEYYAYDADTGELTLNQSAAMIQSVSVSVEEDSVVEKLSSLLFPAIKAYALTADQMTTAADNIELPEWVSTGTVLTGSAYYAYGSSTDWKYSYGFGVNSEALMQEMVNLIEYGGSLDMSRLASQAGSKYLTVHTNLSVNTLTSNGQSVPGLQNIPEILMECCHVDTVLGSVSGSDVNGGNWSLQPARLRFLNVDREKGYAIIGVYTVETHTQTGCAFFKIGIKPSVGYGNIAKKDAQSDEVVAGAVYQVYTDSACTVNATDADGNNAVFTTTTSKPYSNTITFTPGTYYVKETQVPEGYMLDTGVKILNIRSGEQSWATASGGDFEWNYDNRQVYLNLKKISGDHALTDNNACYSLSGAIYGVYQSKNDALSDANRIVTFETDASGNSNTVRLDTGTYYVKELEASPGYAKCTGAHDEADSDGIHTVKAENYGETYTVTCAEPVLGSAYRLQLRKWDNDTKEQTAQGQASLAGAVFRVDYYDNTDGNCSGTPKRTWFYQTDDTGVIYGDDAQKLLESFSYNGKRLSGSTELFTRTESGSYVLPLGSYHISELQAPAYYQLSGIMKLDGETGEGTDVSLGKTLVVKEKDDTAVIYNGDSLSSGELTVDQYPVNVYDTIYRGSIKIVKQDSDGQPMEGVSFRLRGETTGEEYKAVTDENGEIVWTDLLPQTYRVTEIKTADDTSLLADDITVQLPLEVAENELTEDLDSSKAVWDSALGKYCFYDLNYEITNHKKLLMPLTGNFPYRRAAFGVSGAALMLLGFRTAFWRRKRELCIWKGVGEKNKK